MKHNFSRRLYAVILTLALALSLTTPAWAEDTTTTPDPFTVTLTAGEGFDPGTVGTENQPGVLYDGDEGQLTATITPPADTDTVVIEKDSFDYGISWSSNDPSIATVTGRGTNAAVGAVSQGTATITAKVEATWRQTDSGTTTTETETGIVSKSFTVQVKPVLVTEVKMSPTEISLPVGTSRTLSATVYPRTATNTTVTWSSDNTNVATVDQTGKVTALAEGKANIIVKANGDTEGGGEKSANCVVTVTSAVIPADGLTLDKDTLELQAQADGVKLTATVTPAEATNKDVTWSSSNVSIAIVDKDGLVKGITPGTAVITATTTDGRFSASCTVTVTAAASTGVTISSGRYTNENPLYLDIGSASVRLIASVEPQGANQAVTWTSGDESIAKVDSQGNVTAVGVGKTTITATSVSDSTKSASCPVEVSGVTVSGFPATMRLNQSVPLTLDTLANAKDNLKKNWVSNNPAVAAVDSRDTLTARGIGSATITLTCTSSNGTVYPVEPASFTVTVVEDTGTIYYGSATAGAPYSIEDIMPELNRICRTTTGSDLSYLLNVTVPTREGVLYYNHISTDNTGFGVGATERYYYDEDVVGERYMGGLTFVPNSDFNGETTITYSGYTADNKTYNGKIRLSVTGSGNVTFITKAGQPLTFSSAGFSAASRSKTGRDVDKVSFTLPDEDKGLFCYGYAGGSYRYTVTEGEQYFHSRTPYIDQVSFLPAEYYIGTLSLPFQGEDTAGISFTGRLYIIVAPNRPEGERSELTTTALRGSTVDFEVFDFQAACRAVLSENLSYVRFTPPDSSTGDLYYKYTSTGRYEGLVNANTRYYPGRTPKLSDLTFVPVDDRIQPVAIDFVGYSSSGKSFNGTVTIYYRDSGSVGEAITYAATSGQAIPFEPADFDKLCQDLTGKSLSRIEFAYLPDSSEGTLFRNYSSGSSTGTKVTTKDRISRASLSGVAFAPRSDFVGSVELEFNGYTADSTRFTGTVRINVEEGNTTLHYSTYSGSSVDFDAGDFNDICTQSTNGRLNYVRFQLPNNSQGKLYYRYNNSSSSRGSVSASSSYYYSTSGSNRLSSVYFTAASNYVGIVSIDYTGFSTSGARFTGTVEIDVSYNRSTMLSYSSTSVPFHIPSGDIVSACSPLLDRQLSYVTFNALPEADQGKLYYDYAGYGTGTAVTSTSTKYYRDKASYLDRLVFVPKEGFEGTLTLPYTAYDTRDGTVSGTVDIEVIPPDTSAFVDMDGHVWAIPSVEFLFDSGVVEGIGSSRYDPSGSITRGDFVLILHRMFHFRDAGTQSFSDVPEDSYYAQAIAGARSQNVLTGVDDRFCPEEPITRQDAMLYLRNAMRAAGKSIPSGTTSELRYFADYNTVSDQARSAMTSMIHMGIIRGDDRRCLNPTSPISRAEMAVVIHRTMTL